MGLGFFIARTLLERTGGVVSVGQGLPRPEASPEGRAPLRGARVAVRWARPALEVAS
jgi:two-component system sensor histidine kinase RegB